MRRGQVNTMSIALLIIGLIIGGVIGYFMAPKAPAAPENIQNIIQENEQLKAKVNELLQKLKPGEITVKIWTIGPNAPSEYRLKNFEIAVNMLNS